MPDEAADEEQAPARGERTRVPLWRIAREWTRIGFTGFGGPPAHIALLRRLVVEREGWMDARSFQDANAACGLLPGPASTQLAIYCAYRLGGPLGALVGGLGFVLPAVVLVMLLSFVFLGHSTPLWVRGAGAGAGAAVAAVAVQAARGLAGPSFAHARGSRAHVARWALYVAASAAAAALVGPYLVLVLLACGLIELVIRRRPTSLPGFAPVLALAARGGFAPLAWTALKVGALSFGGGFVIVPLMQGDAVHTYHWMTNARFLDAVALGQITPGPVTATIAAVGYAAHGIPGALIAAVIAFIPSFAFILIGATHFERLRENTAARAFLDGAGAAAIGAILGAAVLLGLALGQAWQFGVLTAAMVMLLLLRRGVVTTLVCAGAAGVIAVVLAGAPV